MHPIYRSLAEVLRTRLTIIGDRALRESDPAEQLNQLKAASERIVQIQKELPGDCDPHLQHYLQNCSYDKALAFLESSQTA